MPDENNRFLPYGAARGTLYLIVKSLASNFSGAIFFIFVARFLPTVSDLGLITGVSSVIAIATIIANLGLPGATTRFISRYIGAGKEEEVKGIPGLILITGLISSAVVSFVLYLSSNYITSIFFHETKYSELVRLASIDTFLLSMITFATSILLANQQFKRISIISIINSVVKYALASAFLISGIGLDGIIIGWIIGDVLCLAMFAYVLVPNIRRGITHEIKPLFEYSLPLYGSAILDFLAVNLDRYLLLLLSNLHEVGIYSPAILIGSVLAVMLGSLDQALLPYFSRIYGKSGADSLQNLSRFVSRYLFMIFLPVGFTTLVFAQPLITIILGGKYYESAYPSVIIILAITLTSIGTIFNNILMSAGHTRIFLKSNIVASSFQTALALITIPFIGVIGAALARSSAYVILFFIPAYALKKTTGLHYDHVALQRGLVGSIIMSAIMFTINFFSNQYYLPISLFVGLFSYLLFLRFTHTINIKDIEVINNILSGRLKWLVKILTRIVMP
jgi:O-antigen/teichoic acid export membrane protein